MATTLTYTAGDMCTEALRDAGIVAVDREASSDEIDVAIIRLNMMLKSLQGVTVTVWKQTTASIAMTDATASYVITERPLDLLTVNKKESGGNEVWLQKLTRREYYELPDKTTVGEPSSYYYHREKEQGTLYVWTVQATAGTDTIEWTGRAEISDVAETTDTMEVPAEYYEAILYGLALRLSSAFGTDKPLLPGLAGKAMSEATGFDTDGSIYFEPEYG